MFAAWRRGPAEYKLRFVDGRRPPLDEPSSLGISLHRALERYHRAGEPGWEALAQAYEAEFLRAGYPDEEARERWRRKGLRILKAYQRGESSRRTKILGNEREFVFPLGRHTVRGMVDRIDLHP
ncbi:MAG: PD-(D/E)XK nuclease family protein, partial [Elusimicrobia bacterium]|nr:PD-(D/E)XK nuclease family protein [Elusimicrobiota bacterium]